MEYKSFSFPFSALFSHVCQTFKMIKSTDSPVRGSSFTFQPSDPACVGGSRATEEMKNMQHDEDPRMSDRDRGRGRRIERERETGWKELGAPMSPSAGFPMQRQRLGNRNTFKSCLLEIKTVYLIC